MGIKVSIIGAGSVGASIAYTMTLNSLVSEIVLVDIKREKAFGEALDIRQGTPFAFPVKIYDGDYSDTKDSDIVIVTSGIPRKPGQSRIDLAQTNVDIIKQIAPQLVKHAPNAFYLIVSNPVDILTYAFIKASGLWDKKILGTGTILDTARLRVRLAEFFDVSQKNVHAYVFGEHGDSSFIPWSMCTISSLQVDEYCKSLTGGAGEPIVPDYKEIEDDVRSSGGRIIASKGATYYAISTATYYLCKCLMGGHDTVTTVSSMFHGEYGINDVCLSSLSLVGQHGVKGKVTVPLTDEEVEKLRNSAAVLKKVIKDLKL